MSLLGDVGGFFFGEDPKLETKQKSLLSAGQNKGLEEFLLPFLTGTPLDQVRGTPFEGERVAGVSDLESRLLGAGGGAIDRSAGTFSGFQDALQPLLEGNVGDFEEFFQSTIAEPGIEQFERDILPLINRQFSGSGFHGSERREDRMRATEDLNKLLTQSRSDIGFKTRESALNRVLQAVQAGSGAAGAEVGALAQLQPLAQTERGIEQAGLDADFQEFLRVDVEERDKRIRQLLEALNVQPVENIGAGLPGSSGFISDFFAGGGGAGLMSMFSDRRLKSDIVKVAQTPAGQAIYSYKIFGQPQIGVMADESPVDAVYMHPSGYLMVDYARIK